MLKLIKKIAAVCGLALAAAALLCGCSSDHESNGKLRLTFQIWDDAQRAGETQAYFAMVEQIAQTILPYENVRLFYFQDLLDYTSNLDHYRDYGHYRPEMNEYICESMAQGRHELTLENLHEVLQPVKEYVDGFDYETFATLSPTSKE